MVETVTLKTNGNIVRQVLKWINIFDGVQFITMMAMNWKGHLCLQQRLVRQHWMKTTLMACLCRWKEFTTKREFTVELPVRDFLWSSCVDDTRLGECLESWCLDFKCCTTDWNGNKWQTCCVVSCLPFALCGFRPEGWSWEGHPQNDFLLNHLQTTEQVIVLINTALVSSCRVTCMKYWKCSFAHP